MNQKQNSRRTVHTLQQALRGCSAAWGRVAGVLVWAWTPVSLPKAWFLPPSPSPCPPPVSVGSPSKAGSFAQLSQGQKWKREWWVMFAGYQKVFSSPHVISLSLPVSGQRRSQSLGGRDEGVPFPRVLSWEHLFLVVAAVLAVYVLCTGVLLFCCSF